MHKQPWACACHSVYTAMCRKALLRPRRARLQLADRAAPAQELADALSLRDAWLHGRMTMLIGGSGGGPHQPSHHQGLARMLMHVQLHDVRRISMLKLVVSLADSHQEACGPPCSLLC